MIEDEISQIVQARVSALVHRDIAALEQILADDFMYTNAGGSVLTKQEYLDTYVKPPEIIWHSQEMSDLHIQVYTDAAVLTARIHDRATFNGNPFDKFFRTTQVYVRVNGEWKYAAGHTGQDTEE